MRESLESAYDFKTRVDEEKLLLRGLGGTYPDYVVFSDYRRNEGLRRFREISDYINGQVDEIECSDSMKAGNIYLETLRGVLLQTRWVQVLETYANTDNKKK
jgi:hypothetical protein